MSFSNYSIIDPFRVGSEVDKHVLFCAAVLAQHLIPLDRKETLQEEKKNACRLTVRLYFSLLIMGFKSNPN